MPFVFFQSQVVRASHGSVSQAKQRMYCASSGGTSRDGSSRYRKYGATVSSATGGIP